MANSIIIEKVYERDIDLLVMRLLSTEPSVLEYFCNKMKITDYKLQEVAHSVSDINGESDIVVKLSKDGLVHLLMIENKIDAAAQPEQYARYKKRGDKQLRDNNASSYSVCIMAPAEYLAENSEAQKYDFKVAYEDLLELDTVKNDVFASAMLKKAVEKKQSAGEISLAVSEFWQNYYLYQQEHYPWLNLNYGSANKGPYATWPSFKTGVPGTRLIHKSEQGYVDLEFSGKAEQQAELAQRIKPYKHDDMHWRPTGGSASIGIEVSKVDFSKGFTEYQEEMRSIFDAISRLQKLVLRLYDEGLSS